MMRSRCALSCRGWGRRPPQAGGRHSACQVAACGQGSVAAGQQGHGLPASAEVGRQGHDHVAWLRSPPPQCRSAMGRQGQVQPNPT
eukprot:6496120-Alexandrium_andersonii.AAC.1